MVIHSKTTTAAADGECHYTSGTWRKYWELMMDPFNYWNFNFLNLSNSCSLILDWMDASPPTSNAVPITEHQDMKQAKGCGK